ncbi:MAG: MG2 domain-containing protein [Bacteroidetes bacterium]|nr:MG2 domain-containing protein [Bacteroidota bacterium]
MKSKLLLSKLFFLGCALLLLNSCFHNKPKIKQVNPAFLQFISGYTSGMISRTSHIRVELAHGINEKSIVKTALGKDSIVWNYTLPDSNLLEDIFTFDPEIKGKAHWVSNRVIEFFPAEPLPVNQFYDVEFDLGKVMKVKSEFKNFEFQFATFPQTLNVEVFGLRTYDDYDVEWQKLTGKIYTSDYEDTANLKKVLHVTLDGKELPVTFEQYYNPNEHHFYVDSIPRKETKGNLLVSWNGESINSMSVGKSEWTVPALGDFNVNNAVVTDGDEQSVVLTFSDPISYGQNLKGIVTLDGIENLTYDIDGNVVTVFLPNRFEGDKTLRVSTGIKNFKGHKMNVAYSNSLFFDEAKPRVRIKGKGSILPNSNGLIFPFEAINLNAVDVRIIKIYENNVHQFLQTNNLDGDDDLTRVGKIVAEKTLSLKYDKTMNLKQWNKHVIDLNKWMSPEPGAIYRVCIKFSKAYSLYACAAVAAENNDEENEEEEYYDYNSYGKDWDSTWNEYNWNSYGFSGYQTWNDYYDSHNPCEESYYNGLAVCRNILASDIGMIYKLDENRLSHAFLTNMISAKPLAGATVEYYDYAKQIIASGVTDANGMLDIQLKEKPFLMLAKWGKQRGYLKLGDGHALSLSKFDVEGEEVQKGIKGFLYGERGVWRPGDSLYLTFIMEDKQKKLPPNHPVKFELHDPNGQVIYHTTKTKNVNGMFDFRASTSADAPTGNYQAIVRVGNRTFTYGLKIETIKPNRLKIYLDPEKGKVNDSTSKLTVKWLHGAVAKDLRATVNVSVNQTTTSFGDKFKNYVFDSPIRSYYAESEAIFDAKLDANGEALVKTKLNVGQTAPGMLRTTYLTRVFEEGGDFSIDKNTTIYSPYNTYVGLKSPDSDNYDQSLETGNNYKFDVVTLSDKGALTSTEKLQVKIYKIQWRWWYEHNEDDLTNYVSRHGSFAMKDTIISAKNGMGSFTFQTHYPDYGRYLITVTDMHGKHQTGKMVYIDWPYWRRGNRSGNENATMLNFSCDKEKYVKGENIKLTFPSSDEGMALVSVETRTAVVEKFWIATKKGETVYEFPSTAAMSPNAYVHVTLVQPHASTKNDLPIRMYGVVPITVDDPLTHLNPEIACAESFKPESTVNIKVKEKDGRKMTYTLAIVDEGLLDLTRYKTPQPWTTFYAKEALGVKTWDMYDYVIGAYAGKLDKLLSIGGDGDAGMGKDAKANRFKPMVKFMGPFTVEAGTEKNHSVKIPNYVGSVRIMVVTGYEGAYGSTEKTVPVKKPLMVLATLPRVLGPTEQVYLPVDVFAMEANIKDVKVDIEVNDLLSIDGAKSQTIHFDRIGDEVLNFKLNVAAKVGIARVKITATSGKEITTQEIELDVRPSNPKVTDGSEIVIEPGKEGLVNMNFIGLEGTNKATIELSTVPPMGLEKRLDYLIQYPHGCIEQTTSSVFPQLFLINLMDMKETQKTKIAENIKAGIKRLQLFQTHDGGFSYWPGESYSSVWGTNYGGHFIIAAEKLGYSLPVNMKSNWVKYQQQQARNWFGGSTYNHPHGNESAQMIQAYRLYVLALSGNAELGAMNRLREEKTLALAAKWRLAAAYMLVGQKEAALSIIRGLPVVVAPYKELSYSYGSNNRDQAMILETLSLLGERAQGAILAKEVAKILGSDRWLSTQETAYGLLAMAVYTGASGEKSDMTFSYKLNETEMKNQNASKCLYQVKYSDKDFSKKASVTLKNTGKTTLFVKVIVEGIPLIGDKTSSGKDLKMEVVYKDMQGNEIQPDKIMQGTDFFAEVTMSHPGNKVYAQYDEMALNQIFPSGWEIHNARLFGDGTSGAARYQDIRDDRVYSYYSLSNKETKKFTIQLNATYLGKFYLPTVYSEAMYDNTINARVAGRWIEVVK